MTTRACNHLLFCFCTILMISGLGLTETVSFSRNTFANAPSDFAYADLNNDGREDRIQACGSGAGSGNGQFAVSLSTGNGTYAPQVCYTLPSGAVTGIFAVGDFNNDGSLDLMIANGPTTFLEYLNNSDGTFHLQTTFTTPVQMISMVAADANHDGRIDLIWTAFQDPNLYVWLGDGKGGFSPGPASPIEVPGMVSVGDFDGDGKLDILLQFNTFGNTIRVAYGDGQGRFQTTPSFSDDAVYHAYDIDGDGIMDLIGSPFDFSLNGSTYYRVARVLHGNSNRTLTRQDVPLSQCTAGALGPAVADFNGDGISDLVVAEGSDCSGSPPYSVNVLLGNPDGSYQPEQVLYSTRALPRFSVIRANRDSKPDLLLYGNFQGTSNTTEVLFSNTTAGAFPSCRPPDSATGIALCSPNREVVQSSPVRFSIAAANQTPAHKVEVWVDGNKAGESLSAWSYYSFLDAKYNLAAGSHVVTMYSAGWDNLLESTTFPLVVGSSLCRPPTTPGLNVCSPLPHATVNSPALAWASGTVTGSIARMEVWVDGVKKFSTFGSNTLKTTIPLASGSHTLVYYVVNTTGTKWRSTVTARVP
jgi:hypothetical protein